MTKQFMCGTMSQICSSHITRVFVDLGTKCAEFGSDNVRLDQDRKGGGTPEFPVLSKDGRIVSSLTQSQVSGNLPEAAIDYVFVEPSNRERATKWLNENREDIIERAKEEDRGSIE